MIGRRSFFMLLAIWLMGIVTGALAAGALMPPRGEIICSPAGNEVNHISMRGIRQDTVPEAVEAIVNAVCHRGVRV